MSGTHHRERSWKRCSVCAEPVVYKTPTEFSLHLRDNHCSKEGGSFVCKYGYNNVCSSLPVEGVSDIDYENHVAKHHVLKQHGQVEIGVRTGQSNYSKMPPLLHTNQPNVVTDQGKWSIYNSTQNLPAVLNDPTRVKQKDFFTKTWGDEMAERAEIPRSIHLPEVTRAHFDSYLRKTSKRYKKHIRQANSLPRLSSSDDPSQMFPILQATRQLAEKNRMELDNIPKMFLQSDFSLENPETFEAVFPWTTRNFQAKPLDRSDSAATNPQLSAKLLQEKLTHYLDIVEVQIAYQISLKSAAFFTAMTSHDALKEQLAQTVHCVKRLRDKIHQIDDVLVKGPLKIMSLQRTRQNYRALYNKLKLMATVHQTQPTIQLLLSSSEFVGALDLIATTQEVLAQELAGIHSFRHLGSQLAEMEKLIDKMMQADFMRYATADLNRPLSDEEPVMEEDRLVSIVFGMMHQRKYNFVEVYKEEAFTAIKAVIKQAVIEAVSQADNVDTEGNLGRTADQVRLLSLQQWMDLLKQVFEDLLCLLNRIKAVHGVVSDAVDIAGGKAHCPNSPSAGVSLLDTPEVTKLHVAVDTDSAVIIPEMDHRRLVEYLKDLLTAVCDHAHDRCSKLLAAKAKDGFIGKLASEEFVILSKCIEQFISSCEQICGRKSTSLCLGLQAQANRFVNRFHDERKTKLGLILDSEQWKQADVPSEFQDLVDYVASSGKLAIPKKISESDIIEEKRPERYLFIANEKYAVVGTVLLLLKMVVEYCQCVTDIPSIAPDLLMRLIELIKMFNSRTCQLILGAGAVQLVGLRTITSRNIALASRCLQVIGHYIPLLKEHFTDLLPTKQKTMYNNFDQVLKDYKDHMKELSKKLVSIIDGVFQMELEKWEAKPPVPSPSFRTICKKLTKFHEAIADLLPHDQIKVVFFHINIAFKKILQRHLEKLNITKDGGPKYSLATSEVALYVLNLKSLDCFSGENDLDMDSIWVKR